MNKKGFVWLIPILIIGGVALVGVFSGWFTANKLNNIFSGIPSWFWIVLVIILFLTLLKSSKR